MEIVRKDDPDRYLLSLFAPYRAQRGLWALYAFNQEVAKIRDSVSEKMLGEIRIQWWQDVLVDISEGTVREQPIIKELAHLLQKVDISKLLTEMLDGRRSDLLDEGAATFEALCDYADKVGGTLYAAAAIIEHDDLSKIGQRAARQLGSAWAMLGLIRALPHSWQTNATPITDDMKPGMRSTEAADANALLQPVIKKMAAFIKEQRVEAVSAYGEMPKNETSLLLLSKQITFYQKALERAGNNPFEMVRYEPSKLKKMIRLFWAKTTRRY